jgi:hypothetical protein
MMIRNRRAPSLIWTRVGVLSQLHLDGFAQLALISFDLQCWCTNISYVCCYMSERLLLIATPVHFTVGTDFATTLVQQRYEHMV